MDSEAVMLLTELPWLNSGHGDQSYQLLLNTKQLKKLIHSENNNHSTKEPASILSVLEDPMALLFTINLQHKEVSQ